MTEDWSCPLGDVRALIRAAVGSGEEFVNSNSMVKAHTFSRFGHTNDITVFVDQPKSVQDDYIVGLASASIVLFVIFLIWFIVILVMKCCLGWRKVGFFSGRQVVLPREPIPPEPVGVRGEGDFDDVFLYEKTRVTTDRYEDGADKDGLYRDGSTRPYDDRYDDDGYRQEAIPLNDQHPPRGGTDPRYDPRYDRDPYSDDNYRNDGPRRDSYRDDGPRRDSYRDPNRDPNYRKDDPYYDQGPRGAPGAGGRDPRYDDPRRYEDDAFASGYNDPNQPPPPPRGGSSRGGSYRGEDDYLHDERGRGGGSQRGGDDYLGGPGRGGGSQRGGDDYLGGPGRGGGSQRGGDDYLGGPGRGGGSQRGGNSYRGDDDDEFYGGGSQRGGSSRYEDDPYERRPDNGDRPPYAGGGGGPRGGSSRYENDPYERRPDTGDRPPYNRDFELHSIPPPPRKEKNKDSNKKKSSMWTLGNQPPPSKKKEKKEKKEEKVWYLRNDPPPKTFDPRTQDDDVQVGGETFVDTSNNSNNNNINQVGDDDDDNEDTYESFNRNTTNVDGDHNHYDNNNNNNDDNLADDNPFLSGDDDDDDNNNPNLVNTNDNNQAGDHNYYDNNNNNSNNDNNMADDNPFVSDGDNNNNLNRVNTNDNNHAGDHNYYDNNINEVDDNNNNRAVFGDDDNNQNLVSTKDNDQVDDNPFADNDNTNNINNNLGNVTPYVDNDNPFADNDQNGDQNRASEPYSSHEFEDPNQHQQLQRSTSPPPPYNSEEPATTAMQPRPYNAMYDDDLLDRRNDGSNNRDGDPNYLNNNSNPPGPNSPTRAYLSQRSYNDDNLYENQNPVPSSTAMVLYNPEDPENESRNAVPPPPNDRDNSTGSGRVRVVREVKETVVRRKIVSDNDGARVSTAYDPNKSPEEYAVESDEFHRLNRIRKRRLMLLRIVVLLCLLGIIISAILLLTKGIQNIFRAIEDGAGNMDYAINLTDQAIVLVDQFQQRQQYILREAGITQGDVNSFCPDVRDQICSDINDANTCDFTGIPVSSDIQRALIEMKTVVGSDLGSIEDDLQATRDDIKYYQTEVRSYYWSFWLCFTITIILILVTFVLMLFICFAMGRDGRRVSSSSPLRSCCVGPCFITLIILMWLFAMIFAVGSLSTGDFCIDSPNKLADKIIETKRAELGPNPDPGIQMVWDYAEYVVNGCPSNFEPQMVFAVLDNLAKAGKVVDDFSDEVSLNADSIAQTCGTNPNRIDGISTLLSGQFCLFSLNVIDVLEFFSCKNWYPLYESIFYDSACYQGQVALHWVTTTLVAIVIFGLIVVTLRAAFYELGEEELEEAEKRKEDRMKRFPTQPKYDRPENSIH